VFRLVNKYTKTGDNTSKKLETITTSLFSKKCFIIMKNMKSDKTPKATDTMIYLVSVKEVEKERK